MGGDMLAERTKTRKNAGISRGLNWNNIYRHHPLKRRTKVKKKGTCKEDVITFLSLKIP